MNNNIYVDKNLRVDFSFLNDSENCLINRSLERLHHKNNTSVLEIEKKLINLDRMSTAISDFPSIHETSVFAGEERSRHTLIENLCCTQPDSRMLSIPTKAIFGRGFLVAKLHAFSALTKIAANYSFPNEEIEALRTATMNIMFTLMSEDVYISILDANLLPKDKQAKVADALTYLWEYRLDKNITAFAPVLTSVWTVRDKIAPAFGTMMGTSELFLLSTELDETWGKFVTEKLSNTAVCQALEEFLFGISHEDILLIRNELSNRRLINITRDDAAKLLNRELDFKNIDARLFYTSYVQRQNNAIARKRLNVTGPKNTLEDYYISFLFENGLDLDGTPYIRRDYTYTGPYFNV